MSTQVAYQFRDSSYIQRFKEPVSIRCGPDVKSIDTSPDQGVGQLGLRPAVALRPVPLWLARKNPTGEADDHAKLVSQRSAKGVRGRDQCANRRGARSAASSRRG